MTPHDSRPTEGQSEHEDDTARRANDRKPEHSQPRHQGSPIPENVDELQDPQSRLTLRGDAYGAFGNDSDHESAPAASRGSTPADAPARDVPTEDPYGRDDQPTDRSGTGRADNTDVSSDKRLRELICEHLTRDHKVDISDVTVEVSAGCVTLKGTIPDHRMNALIEEAVVRSPGVEAVNNRIQVVFGRSGPGDVADT